MVSTRASLPKHSLLVKIVPGYYQNEPKADKCKECIRGQYQSLSGMTNCTACSVDESEQTELQAALGVQQVNMVICLILRRCQACPVGQFADEGDKAACKKCPAGKHGDNKKNLSSCVPCRAGTWSSAEAALNADTCTNCTSGKHGGSLAHPQKKILC